MKLSPAQERVLYWLWAHPTVMIAVYPGDAKVGRSSWTHYWRDAEAFQHMRKMASILNGGFIEAPRRAPCEGGTPRLTTATFVRLRDARLISVARYRRPDGVMCAAWYYSISAKGKEAIGDLADVPATRAPRFEGE